MSTLCLIREPSNRLKKKKNPRVPNYKYRCALLIRCSLRLRKLLPRENTILNFRTSRALLYSYVYVYVCL